MGNYSVADAELASGKESAETGNVDIVLLGDIILAVVPTYFICKLAPNSCIVGKE